MDVISVHWNAPNWLTSSIESLRQCTDIDARFIVVDNSRSLSTDELPEGVELVTPSSNLGYAGGANFGLTHALRTGSADYLAVAAHDAVVEKNTLARLVEAMESNPDVGVCGPGLKRPAVAGGIWNGRRARFTPSTECSRVGVSDCDWLSGTLLLARRTAWIELDGFDERFGSYVEDVDLCLRASDLGWRVVVVPGATAAGQGSVSSAVTQLVDINSALLAVKREGTAQFTAAILVYVFWFFRGLVASVHLGRPRWRRISSLRHACDHMVAASKLLISPGRVLDFHRSGRHFPGSDPALRAHT